MQHPALRAVLSQEWTFTVWCQHVWICSHIFQHILPTGSYVLGGKRMVHGDPQGRGQMTKFTSHKSKVWAYSLLFQYTENKLNPIEKY